MSDEDNLRVESLKNKLNDVCKSKEQWVVESALINLLTDIFQHSNLSKEELLNDISECWDFKNRSLKATYGCSVPIGFMTSEGLKIMVPGKEYDENLNAVDKDEKIQT